MLSTGDLIPNRTRVGETDRVAVDVVTEVVINRPCPEVAAYAADPSHAPEWYENLASVEWLTHHRSQVGSRLAFVARFLGRRLAYTYEVDGTRAG